MSPLGGKRLGYVRNNKAGSTTIINYLGQLLWNEKPTWYSGTNVQDYCGDDSYIGREKGFEAYHKELKACEIRIAVYRDPIDKIIAGFYYCQEMYPNLNNLDSFLESYHHQLKKQLHPNSLSNEHGDMLGPDPSIYTHVWNMNEIDTKLASVPGTIRWRKRYRKQGSGNTNHGPSLKRKKQKLEKSWLLTIKTDGVRS